MCPLSDRRLDVKMYLTIKLLESGGQIRSQVLNDLSKFMQVSELKTKIEVGEKKYLPVLYASFPDPLGYRLFRWRIRFCLLVTWSAVSSPPCRLVVDTSL